MEVGLRKDASLGTAQLSLNNHKDKSIKSMKKTYIIPELTVQLMHAEQMIAASITKVGGDAQIELGSGDTPTEADVKSGSFYGETIFD